MRPFITGWSYLRAIFLLLLLLIMAGCSLPSITTGSSPSPCTSTNGSACGVGSGATNLQLFVEPAAGVRPVTDAIRAAQHSIWVEVYILTDTSVIYALEDAANRGLDVRVMLEPHPYGFSATSVQKTLEKLKDAGVKVNTSNPAFQFTHAKFILIDGSTLFLMTANLSQAALGGSKYEANREYLLDDTEAQDAQEAQSIFTGDWNRTTPALTDSNLVVSPVNARTTLLALINSAHSSLYIEDEEMLDQESENAMAQAASRGVKVEVVLPAPSGSSDSSAAGVAFLRKAHVSVREDKKLYIHAKLVLVDGSKAFVGSENFSSTSLDKNRELGLIIAAPEIIQTLETTFMDDYAASQ